MKLAEEEAFNFTDAFVPQGRAGLPLKIYY
jgi:hypothetical protein